MDCLFCKIINREVPAEIIYEDESIICFLDINPSNPGHALVVPKVHCENLLDASGETLRSLISIVPKISRAIMSGLNYDAFNFSVNNGAAAGQIISHLHFHIVPRREGDGHKLFGGKPYEPGEIEQVAEKIKAAF
ncbi:HIT family protein [Patescibacteria group bacterium]|nr:HIT family protein [Patescibacteria group bacterium]